MQGHQLHGIVGFTCLRLSGIECSLIQKRGEHVSVSCRDIAGLNVRLNTSPLFSKAAGGGNQFIKVFKTGLRFFAALFFVVWDQAAVLDHIGDFPAQFHAGTGRIHVIDQAHKILDCGSRTSGQQLVIDGFGTGLPKRAAVLSRQIS